MAGLYLKTVAAMRVSFVLLTVKYRFDFKGHLTAMYLKTVF